MNINLAQRELDHLLVEHPDSSIWSQKMRKSKIPPLLLYILFAVMLIAILGYGIIYKRDSPDFINQFISICITIYLVVNFTYYIANVASTLVYTIYPSHITFEWGLFKKKKVEIPFEDITAIELVTYSDKDTSTIYFGTTGTYQIEKIDFDANDSRPHITFENIKNGQEVYDLLKYLQNNAQKVSA